MLAAPAVAASGPVQLAYAYAGPASIEGIVSGSCDVAGAILYGGDLHLHATAGRLVVRDTWINLTEISGNIIKHDVRQDQYESPPQNGSWRITWGAAGLAVLYDFHPSAPINEKVRAEFAATGVALSAVEPSPVGPGTFWWNRTDSPGLHLGQFAGWNRRVVFDGTAMIEGNFTLLLREAQILPPEGPPITLDPYHRSRTILATPASETKTLRVHDALLEVAGARMQLAPAAAAIYCGALEGHATGIMTVAAAHGEARAGDEKLRLDGQVLSYSGSYAWSEYPRDLPTHAHASGWMDATAEGEITMVGIDFAPQWNASTISIPGRTLAGILALIAAAVWLAIKHAGSLVGFLYARVLDPQKALKHPNRRRVLEAVRQQPGANFTQLSQTAAIPFNTLKYHLLVLRRVGEVHFTQIGQTQHVWPGRARPFGTEPYRRAVTAGKPGLELVLQHLREGPRPLQSILGELTSRLGLTVQGARRCVRRAETLGLIELDPEASKPTRGGRAYRCR
jgi:predicted transcriptional regulator